MAGGPAVPLAPQGCFVYCLRRKRTFGGVGGGPCPGSVLGLETRRGCFLWPGLYPQHIQEPGGASQQNPSDPGRGRSSTKDLNPPTPALAGGLHGSGDPQDPPAWGGSRCPPPPECVGSPPTPSAVRLHAACAPVGRLGVKHLTDSGRNQPSRAASPLDSGGSRCVTVQVWEVTTILPPVAVTQVSLEPPGPVCVYGLICRGQDGNLAGCP